jgi:DNA-binding GntR family transcriptional regulator
MRLATIRPIRARDEVRRRLEALIVDGSLPPGARLEETEVSQQLGVSRTPLREALIALEEKGLVQSTPNKGFSVAPVNERLVREVYPILAALEAAAVRAAGARLLDSATRLRAINDRLAREQRKQRQYRLDAEFHHLLIVDCGNPRLISLIEQHWAHAQRFNGAHERGTADRAGSCRQHGEIIEAVEAERWEEAAQLVTQHWADGIQVVIKWLRERPS